MAGNDELPNMLQATGVSRPASAPPTANGGPQAHGAAAACGGSGSAPADGAGRRPRRAAAAAAADLVFATSLDDEDEGFGAEPRRPSKRRSKADDDDSDDGGLTAARRAPKRRGGKAGTAASGRGAGAYGSGGSFPAGTAAAAARNPAAPLVHHSNTNTTHVPPIPYATTHAAAASAAAASVATGAALSAAYQAYYAATAAKAGYQQNLACPTTALPGTMAHSFVPGMQGMQAVPSVTGVQGLAGIHGMQGMLGAGVQGLQAIQAMQLMQGAQALQAAQAMQMTQTLQAAHAMQAAEALQTAQAMATLQALQAEQPGQVPTGAQENLAAPQLNHGAQSAAAGGATAAGLPPLPPLPPSAPNAKGSVEEGLLAPVDDAVAVVAAAAPPRKRGRGSGAAAASAPLVPGNGSKYFPKEAQEEVHQFLSLLVAPSARLRGEVSPVVRQYARRLEPQLRQLVPQEGTLDWSGPLTRLEMSCYRVVEDVCGDLQGPLEAAITTQLSALGRSGSASGNGNGLGRTGSSGGGSEGSFGGSDSNGGAFALGGGGGGYGGQQADQASSLAANRRGRQLSSMMHSFLADLHEAMDELVRVHVDAAKQAAAKQYNDVMAGVLAGLPPELCNIPENVPGAVLPAAVLHNKEPYFSVPEWRKEPFPPRSYEPLTEYAIRSNIPSECAVLRAKLRTRRPDGAAEHFTLEHGKELGLEECKRNESELAAAVRDRRVLVMGQHVIEVDCWGMDCYTRRNIFDAVRESGAFKHFRTGDSEAGGSKSLGAGTTTAAGPSGTDAEDPETADTAAGKVTAPGAAAGEQGNAAPAAAAIAVKQEHGAGGARGPSPTPPPPDPPPADDPTRDDEAIAAALAAEEGDVAQARGGGGRQARGSKRKAAVAAGERLGAGTDGSAAAPGELPLPPAPPPCDSGEAEAINNWIDRQVLCTSIAKGREGWNLLRVLEAVAANARARGDKPCGKAAAAVIARLKQVGWAYFRLHPKGRGVVCAVPGGLPAFTFVEEYLGELHSPWRWFEIQDAIKKLTQQELPDFYNITLERPRDDPDGYDVMFVEAAFMASFASRMSHSCTPNCAAVVVSVNGRLTIAMYAKRRIEQGEELTFDYSSVTESEKEYREAICLCGSRLCRGSYLYYSGSTAFTQVMEQRHNFLHRQVMLLRASVEPPLEADRERLRRHCLGPTSLGDGSLGNNKAPDWLLKWAALVLEYVELERRELPGVLLALPPALGRYTEQSAQIEAEAIAQNRVQQIAITLDKVKHVLRQPGQLQTAPMRQLSEAEVVSHLWSGSNSVAKRTLKCAALHLCSDNSIVQKMLALWNENGAAATGRGGKASGKAGGKGSGKGGGKAAAAAADSDEDSEESEDSEETIAAAVARRGRGSDAGVGVDDEDPLAVALPGRLAEFASGPDAKKAPKLARVVKAVAKKAKAAGDARRLLLALESELRGIDLEEGSGVHTAAADMLHLYGSTLTWFTAERGYKSFASPPIELHEEMVKLHRVKLGAAGKGGRGGGRGGGGGGGRKAAPRGKTAAAARAASADIEAGSDTSVSEPEADGDSDGGKRGGRGGRGRGGRAAAGRGGGRTGGRAGSRKAASAPPAAEAAAATDAAATPAEGDAGPSATADAAGDSAAVAAPKSGGGGRKGTVRLADPSVLSKRYGPWFMWGQLSGWYKQTVYDPTASLSAERRGTLSLPDVESFYGAGNKARYNNKDRTSVLRHIENVPDAQWKTSLPFNFRNDAKIYGSPMFDQVYLEAIGQPERNPMPAVLKHLKSVKTPLQGKAGR